jgi:hypothetical protein
MTWPASKRRKWIRRLRAKYARKHGVRWSEWVANGCIHYFIYGEPVAFSVVYPLTWTTLERRIAYGGRKGRSAKLRLEGRR